MQGMLPAKPAELVHFQAVRVVFLVFDGIVVSLLAFAAAQCNTHTHDLWHLPGINHRIFAARRFGRKKINLSTGVQYYTIERYPASTFFSKRIGKFENYETAAMELTAVCLYAILKLR